MMSNAAQDILQGFHALPEEERFAVALEIWRSVEPTDYGDLSDEALTSIAEDAFLRMDAEEAAHESEEKSGLLTL